MKRAILAIFFSFFLVGIGSSLWAAPIGFQGNPIQFPFATQPLGPGFQPNPFFDPNNRFFFDSNVRGPGFQATPGVFPVDRDPRSRFFDPRLEPQPMGFTPQPGF
jgi:hypothetical protein